MRIHRFGQETGSPITHFNSNFVMSRIAMLDKPAHIGCVYLDPIGNIGCHEAAIPQLLLIVGGEGWVSGDSGEKVHVATGDAVVWERGERHETSSEHGLTAIVIESEALDLEMLGE